MNSNKKIIWISIVDDWELRGDGSGNVFNLQYINSKKLMNLYEDLGIRITFNVEVMQQLAFEKYMAKFENIKKQRDYWLKAIKIMKDKNFDIQLHIHPQWHNANFNGRSWKIGKKWNIVNYSTELIESFLDSSMNYLKRRFSIQPISFRGGSWGVCCPSRPLFEILESKGIKIDISIVNGLYSNTKNIQLDYTQIESPHLPYYPDYDDVRKVSKNKTNIIEIPTQSISRDKRYLLGKVLKKLLSSKDTNFKKYTKKEKTDLNKIIRNGKIDQSIDQNDQKDSEERVNKDCIIMDITSLDRYALQLGFDIIIKRALGISRNGVIPLIIESHTKDLTDEKLENIKTTIKYILKKYGKFVKFVTMKEISENIDLMQPLV